jgi:hypothetical protein
MAGDKTLHITSRSKLDATGKFYSNRSFRDLFIEAYMNTLDSPFYNENIIQDHSSEMCSPIEENNEVSKFYSFLVQHIEHRIVKKNESNRVYLIHSGTVYSDGRVKLNDGSEKLFEGKSNLEKLVPSSIRAKSSYAEIASRSATESDNEVVSWIKQTLQEKNWEFQGLVLKDMNGNRWRFRSEKYAAVKALRGNSPSSIERFAQLYTQNLVSRYQEYYPEEAIHMLMGLTIIESIVKKLYEHYVELHITKTKKAENIDKVFLPHLYNIHGIYLSQLKSNGKKVQLSEINLYLHKQPWQRIVFLIKKVSDGMLNN